MTGNHARVRQLFLAAVELPAAERLKYLRRAEADADIVHEVEALLSHASPQTVLNVRVPELGSQRSSTSVSRLTPFLKWLEPFNASRAARWTTRLVLLTILLIGGWWVSQYLHDLVGGRATQITRSVEESNSVTFESQLEDWRAEVQGVVASLAGHEAALAMIHDRSAANFARFDNIAGSLLGSGRYSNYFIADAQGKGLGKNQTGDALLDEKLFARVLESKKTATGIARKQSGSTVGSGLDFVPTIAFYVPLLDAGKLVGVFVVSRSLDTLATALSRTRALGSVETYLFSPDGVMLSPSRFADQMQKWGLINSPASPQGPPVIHLRDPGRSLAETPVAPGEQPEVWPHTLLVRTVDAARDVPGAKDYSGIISTPYRDYRGELVISAWRWLPDVEVGLATEIDIREAYAIATLLDRALLGLLIGIGLIGAWALLSTSWLVRMGKDLQRRGNLGAYSLIEKIGEGGMGEVYLAQHTFLQRTAALKLLRRDRMDETSAAKFHNEVRVASRLRHPNTVEIYDFGKTKDDTSYYVMQYLPGLNLTEWVQRTGPMPVERTIHIVRQICSALTEAHAEGLLHFDVKPSNVMVCSMGGLYDFVKLLDFGLAVSLRANGDMARADLSGTPYYTAPERLTADAPVDARCDIYSLGVLWYFLLTARLPHDAGMHWVEATLTESAIPLSRYISVDPEVEQLITSCIARDADNRPESALALLSRLEALARRLPWSEESAREAWRI